MTIKDQIQMLEEQASRKAIEQKSTAKPQPPAESIPSIDQGNDPLLEALRDNIQQNILLLEQLGARHQILTTPRNKNDHMPMVETTHDVLAIAAPEMGLLPQEQIRVLLVNQVNRLVAQRVIYIGNVHSCHVRPAEVFRPAIIENSPKIVLVHNHPSRDPTPSPADIAITQAIEECATLMGIKLMDHVIIASDRHVSMKLENLMLPNRKRTSEEERRVQQWERRFDLQHRWVETGPDYRPT